MYAISLLENSSLFSVDKSFSGTNKIAINYFLPSLLSILECDVLIQNFTKFQREIGQDEVQEQKNLVILPTRVKLENKNMKTQFF